MTAGAADAHVHTLARRASTAWKARRERALKRIHRAAGDLPIDDLFPSIDDELRDHAGLLTGRVLNAGAGDRDIRALVPGRVFNQDIAEGLHSRDVDIVSPLHEIPFDDGFFDGIVCNAVLEHVANPEAVIAEFARVSRPGATLYLVVPFMQPEHLDPTDFQRYTLDGLRLLVTRHGFEVIEAEGVHNVYSTLGWIVRDWLSAVPTVRAAALKAVLYPWLRKQAGRSNLRVHSIASAYRVVARRSGGAL